MFCDCHLSGYRRVSCIRTFHFAFFWGVIACCRRRWWCWTFFFGEVSVDLER